MKNKFTITIILAAALFIGSAADSRTPVYVDIKKAQVRQTPAEQIPDYSKFADNKEWTRKQLQYVDSLIAAEKKKIVSLE